MEPVKQPTIDSVGATQQAWFLKLTANQNGLHISKTDGILRFDNTFKGLNALISRDNWKLEMRYIKKAGHVLVVSWQDKASPHKEDFGFWSRDSGGDLGIWVTRVNRRVAIIRRKNPQPG